MSRTIHIEVCNRTGLTLDFADANSTEGPVATSSAPSVANGETITVTATNDSSINGGNKGTFQLTNHAGVTFVVFYTHPQLSGSTYVQIQELPYGYLTGVDAQSYTGDPVTAHVNLYAGVEVIAPSAPTAFAVPLASSDEDVNPYTQTDNCQDFANGMYGPNMRSGQIVEDSYNQSATPFAPADFTGNQLQAAVLEALINSWYGGSGFTSNSDHQLFNFLQNYIAPNQSPSYPLKMWVPEISYTAGSNPSVYTLNGYRAYDFVDGDGDWIGSTVGTFLTLLSSGAHFVAMSAAADFSGMANNSRDLYQQFRNSGLSQRGDLGNSHYCSTAPINTTGEYYLEIEQDFAPAGCALILSLLFGRTVNSLSSESGTYNTFMQLEGWPAHGVTGGSRHMADYAAYQETLWNISTYGACPYSEKRATTIFLAPSPWEPTVYQITRMMPYVGAYANGTYPNGTPQSWLNTDVVSIAQNAPDLPERYYT